MKQLGKFNNSLGVKLAIFGASLFVCLAVVEAGLRLTGYAVTASRQRRFVPPFADAADDDDVTFERYRADGKRELLILALGDSLTNGGNVASYHSYPYFLYKNFAQAGRRTSVYNMGYCEDSTFGSAMKLKAYIQTHPADELPDAAVFLVGAADMFNIPLIQQGHFRDDTYWQDMLPQGGLRALRLYKVYRHIRLNLGVRRGVGGAPADRTASERKLAVLLDAYQRHKGKRGPLAPELVEKIEAAFADDLRYSPLDFSRTAEFLDLLTSYAGRVYTASHRYDKFFGLLLDVAVAFPRDFWAEPGVNDEDTANYNLVQAYRVQSARTADEILKVLERSAAEHAYLRGNDSFRHFQSILLHRDKVDRQVDRMREEAWDEIVRLAREKGIQVVLQNYPVTYKSANEVLRRVAERHQLPLIDNARFFAELIAKDGRAKYFEDDDHLTPLGNELLARNVYEKLAGLKFPS
ncbi:MAG: hypothetical protein ABIJ96_09230 [Elusimicrobiota bacterium]